MICELKKVDYPPTHDKREGSKTFSTSLTEIDRE